MTLRLDSADWVTRIDRGELLASHEREDGTLLVEGYAAREGVLEYRTPNGVRRELVLDSTLRRAAAGLGRAPVTLEHPDPDEHPNGVTPDNYDRLGVGDTDGEILCEGGFVKVRLAVRRRDAIDAIRAGKRELSPGYAVRLDHTPGTHPTYGRYDAVQVERRYNHLALTDRARGGSEIRLRADSGVASTTIAGGSAAISSGTAPDTNPRQGQTARGDRVNNRFVRLLTLLGVTQRVDSDDAAIDAACGALEQRKDSADRADAEAKAKLSAETARADSEKARATALEAEVKRLKDAEQTRVDAAERVDLESAAKTFGLDPAKHADSKALRRAIVAAHLGSEPKADASDEYLRVAYDFAKAKASQTRDDGGRDAGRQLLDSLANPARQDGQGHRSDTGGSQPKRRPTANEAHSARLAEARKAGGAA